jgi:hypothetical protein
MEHDEDRKVPVTDRSLSSKKVYRSAFRACGSEGCAARRARTEAHSPFPTTQKRTSNREPVPTDYSDDEQFNVAWEHWRMVRDRNNAAVRTRERSFQIRMSFTRSGRAARPPW